MVIYVVLSMKISTKKPPTISTFLRVGKLIFPLYRVASIVYRASKSRIHWLASFGREIGGPEKAEAMVKGRGVSLILKSMEIRFRRPVTYPDTVGRFQTLLLKHRVLRALNSC